MAVLVWIVAVKAALVFSLRNLMLLNGFSQPEKSLDRIKSSVYAGIDAERRIAP
jgi:hypothetical protein